MVRERQCVRRADLVTVTPRADPSLAEEYCMGEEQHLVAQWQHSIELVLALPQRRQVCLAGVAVEGPSP